MVHCAKTWCPIVYRDESRTTEMCHLGDKVERIGEMRYNASMNEHMSSCVQ